MGNTFNTTPAVAVIDALVTLDRAAQNPSLAALATAAPGQLVDLLAAASDAIRTACGRDFTPGAYTEYHSGDASLEQEIITRQYPVTGVTRVATDPTAVLVVVNASAANQRATVATTSVGLTLVRVASGVSATTTLAYASYPTLAALATAVGALGNGWGATVQDNYGLWPSADLKPLQGAASATAAGGNGAILEMHVEDLSAVAGDWGGGGGNCDGVGWRLDEETGQLFGRFPRGRMNLRIDYSAGGDVPAAVQQACVFLAADMYLADQRDGSLKSASLGPYKWEAADTNRVLAQSPKVRGLIHPHVDLAKRFGRHG